ERPVERGRGMIDTLKIDADGYPSERALRKIRALRKATPGDLKRFMLEDFVDLGRELPYARCEAFERQDEYTSPVLRIEFATGGWSGCEDFIEAVLSVPLIRLCYYAEWKRGGLHVFEVPLR